MVICPIARAVHCTGCAFLKFCPVKTILGDYGKDDDKSVEKETCDESQKDKSDDSSASPH